MKVIKRIGTYQSSIHQFSIAFLLAGILLSCAPIQSNKITFGVILPLTGSGVDQGSWQQKGLELAKDEINSQGIQGYMLELIYEDSKGGNPKEAIAAYEKLKISAQIPVIFTWGSGVGIALTKLVNDNKIIQMGIATASPDYSTPDDYTFRVFPSAAAEGAFDAELMFNNLQLNNVAVVYVNNDYGVGSKNEFTKKFKELGGAVVDEESVEIGASDARTELTKIKNKNTSAIFLAVYPQEGGIILKQAKEIGLNTQFVASTAILGGKELFDIAGRAADGLLVTTSQFDVNATTAKKFSDEYHKKYGVIPNLYSARAYDGLMIIAQAMTSCDTPINTECIKNTLFSIKNYE
ncbi:MAG: ABC transporter substrate-binding protein, partial [Candidatus Woesearchaeota archaeon]|nr:ABC transporter substrate-binding protein [Candidatus Woesearchaeota archaeon]